jgi:hypothetical protein
MICQSDGMRTLGILKKAGTTSRSSEIGSDDASSLVAGIIQRSISRSKTVSVPIQKIANNSAPTITPAQVWSELIEPRNAVSISTSGGESLDATDRSETDHNAYNNGKEEPLKAPFREGPDQ